MKVLIAAAGTGGHINPGLAIANKIKEEEPDTEIIFVGTNRGLENDLVPRAGYELKRIQVYGISREISFANLKKIIKTIKGFGQARKLIKQLKPDLVVGTGGYICGPVFLAATKYKIPTVLHESNAFPGVTVKMLAKKVDTILVGFKEAKERLADAKHVVVTGTPTKFKGISMTEVEINQEKVKLGFQTDKPLVLIFGGSQGAKTINEAFINVIKHHSNKEYQIMWAAGPKQYEVIKEQLANEKIDIEKLQGIKVVPYIYNMEETMQMADLIISRSGAMTITEISMVGKPAIFIPLPFAAENHQEYNAKVLVNQGAARILYDKELSEDTLNSMIGEMIKDKSKLKQMGENAKKIVKQDVEDAIYKEIKKLIK